MKLKTALLTLSLLLSATNLRAQSLDDIQLGEPGYAGSGCPAGSVSTTLSPDRKSLSILFDQFLLEAGPGVMKTLDRKNCNIAIPVHVPNGLSVSLIAVDYRGYNFLPLGAQSQFAVEYFFAGQAGPKLTKTFTGRLDQDYLLSNNLAVVGNIWSECGRDVNLRIATSMKLQNRNRMEDAMSTVDSTDLRAGIVYKLQYRSCHSTGQDDFNNWF